MSDKKKEEEKKSDEEILFSEVKVMVGGEEHTIRPFTYGNLLAVNEDIEEIFTQLEKRGTKIDIDAFGITTLKNIYFAAMPQVGNIIKKTLKIGEDELNDMALEDVMKLAMAIFNANRESIKNALSPFLSIMTGEEGADENVKTK